MDVLTKQAVTITIITPTEQPTYSTTKMGLHSPSNVYIGDIYDYVKYVTTAKSMIDYLIKKIAGHMNKFNT